MSVAGRPRKPTQAKVLAGTFRPDRSNPDEPNPPRAHINAPDWLKGEARWAWKQITELLGEDGTNVLAQQDRLALSLLCDVWREYRMARRQIEKEGQMITQVTKSGLLRVRHPLTPTSSDAWKRLMMACGQFGITPATLSKTSTRAKPNADPLGALLKRRETR